MEFEVKEITETVNEDAGRMADVAVGAAAEAADAAAHPFSSARKRMRRLEKTGEPIRRSLERQAERAAGDAMEATYDVVSGALAERVAMAGIRVLRSQAERKDIVGSVAYRTLQLMNGGFERAVRSLTKFEDASKPPAREPRRRRPVARTRRTAVRRARRTRRPAAARA